jgi:histidine triad (HIT) family protein
VTQYDPNNIFAKILRGEIPCSKVYEDNHVLAFNDIHPQAPTHVLVCPKGAYVSMTDFTARAGDAEITGLYRAIGKIIDGLGLDTTGYRTITNTGVNGGQEVPQVHIHILGGRALGPMLNKA